MCKSLLIRKRALGLRTLEEVVLSKVINLGYARGGLAVLSSSTSLGKAVPVPPRTSRGAMRIGVSLSPKLLGQEGVLAGLLPGG